MDFHWILQFFHPHQRRLDDRPTNQDLRGSAPSFLIFCSTHIILAAERTTSAEIEVDVISSSHSTMYPLLETTSVILCYCRLFINTTCYHNTYTLSQYPHVIIISTCYHTIHMLSQYPHVITISTCYHNWDIHRLLTFSRINTCGGTCRPTELDIRRYILQVNWTFKLHAM